MNADIAGALSVGSIVPDTLMQRDCRSTTRVKRSGTLIMRLLLTRLLTEKFCVGDEGTNNGQDFAM